MTDNAPQDTSAKPGFLPDNFYDLIKWCALIAFPAFGAAYFSLAGIWHLPAAEQVVGTIVVVDTLLGVLVGVSNSTYNKSDARFDGDITLSAGEQPDVTNVRASYDAAALSNKDEVLLKVKRVA